MGDETPGVPIAETQVPELPTSRLEFNVRWFGLPRSLVVEVEHDVTPDDELNAAFNKLDGFVQKTDLGMACDEASLMGIGRYFCRRTHKLLNGRTHRVTVLWKPEIVTLDSKEFSSRVAPGQA